MNGIIFKELRLNWISVLSILVMPLFFGGLAVFALVSPPEGFFDAEDMNNVGTIGIRAALFIFGYWVGGGLAGQCFQNDSFKKWGYFIASTPVGEKGQVYGKYVYVFMLTCLHFISNVFVDSLVCFFIYLRYGVSAMPLINLFFTMIFVQLVLRSVEMPFYIRLGKKYGDSARMITFLFCVLILMIYGLFGPLPAASMDEIVESFLKWFERFMNGEFTDLFGLIAAVFPFIACALYYLSYRISCTFYLKGVELYDK